MTMAARLLQASRVGYVGLAALLLACGPSSSGGGFGMWTPPILASPEIKVLEHAMFARVNRDRAGARVPALSYDERLADIARAHSLDMRDAGFFAHESPTTGLLEDRMDRAGFLALEMRENLAVAGDVDRAQDNLLESPGHRENIFAPTVTHVGIGIVQGASQDPRALTVTQVFARPADLESPDEVARGVIARIDAARRQHGLPPLIVHPLLEDLAEAHVGALPDGVPPGSTGPIGDEVSRALAAEPGHGLGSIRIVAQLVFSSDEADPPAASLTPAITHVGIAALPGRDERGRPRVKALLLLGRAER